MTSKKRIIIHTPFNPFHALNGAHVRTRKVIELIASNDIETHVIYTPLDGMGSNPEAIKKKSKGTLFTLHFFNTERSFSKLSGLSTESDIYPEDALEGISQLIKNIDPDVCLVNYVFLSKTLTLCNPSTEKYIDTHDKLSRSSVFKDADLEESFFCCTEQHEADLCRRADCIIAITDKEQGHFARIADQKKIITLGHAPPLLNSTKPKPSFEINQKDIINLGILASGHVFNVKSINIFLKSFTPASGTQLNIAGGVCDQIDDSLLTNKKITLHGRVDSSAEFLRNQDLVISPVDHGTGLKIKTIESILSAVPTIGTIVAFDGIKTLSRKGIFEDSKSLGDWLTLQSSEELIRYKKTIENVSLSRAIEYVYCQQLNEKRFISLIRNGIKSSHSSIAPDDTPKGINMLTHIVNITAPNPESDLYVAQRLAVKSIIRAKNQACSTNNNIKIKLVAKVIPDELEAVQQYIDLDGFSIETDVTTSHSIPDAKNPKTRCLPFLNSLLRPEKLNCHTKDSYCIYTNSDICIKECFYTSIASIIESDGNDALVINRRTVIKESCIRDLTIKTANYSAGKTHPGFDCFVMREDILSRFILNDIIIGIHLIGRVILWNIVNFCSKPVIFYDQTLTYHYGDDNSSKNESSHWYTMHNCSAAVKVLKELGDDLEKKIAISELNPNILKITYKPDVYIEPQKKPIIILHGMFRVGSSYFYEKICQELGDKGLSFYEPFHEKLSSYYKKTENHENENAKMHPRLTRSFRPFDSYDKIIQNTKDSKAVPFFSADMSYFDMGGRIEKVNRKKAMYITNLYSNADLRNVQCFLQPNRTWLLEKKQLEQIFDRHNRDTKHFYIYRDSFDQFMSMLTLAKKSGSPSFFRSLLIILFHANNKGIRLFNPSISKIIEKMKYAVGEKEEKHEAVKNIANKLLYPLDTNIAIDIFIETLNLHISRFPFDKCIPIDINKISSSISYRRYIECMLMQNYLYIDLDDCKTANYPKNTDEWEAFCRKGGEKKSKQLYRSLFEHGSAFSSKPNTGKVEHYNSNEWVLIENVSAKIVKVVVSKDNTLLLLPFSKRTVPKSCLKSLPDAVRVM